jgi:broad specificity phosphatase PhoE
MKRIILIRHGESQSNVNKNLHFEKDLYDHLIELSPKGMKQSKACGLKISKLIKKDKYTVFVSSYLRAGQTWQEMAKSLNHQPEALIVEGRIREQEFKDFKNFKDYQAKRERVKKRGKLAYRYKNAESGFDVLDRVSGFYNQLRIDFFLGNREDTVVVVCHEIVIRCFLILALDLNPDDFNTLYIKNCEAIVLQSDDNLKFKRI